MKYLTGCFYLFVPSNRRSSLFRMVLSLTALIIAYTYELKQEFKNHVLQILKNIIYLSALPGLHCGMWDL